MISTKPKLKPVRNMTYKVCDMGRRGFGGDSKVLTILARLI